MEASDIIKIEKEYDKETDTYTLSIDCINYHKCFISGDKKYIDGLMSGLQIIKLGLENNFEFLEKVYIDGVYTKELN